MGIAPPYTHYIYMRQKTWLFLVYSLCACARLYFQTHGLVMVDIKKSYLFTAKQKVKDTEINCLNNWPLKNYVFEMPEKA